MEVIQEFKETAIDKINMPSECVARTLIGRVVDFVLVTSAGCVYTRARRQQGRDRQDREAGIQVRSEESPLCKSIRWRGT